MTSSTLILHGITKASFSIQSQALVTLAPASQAELLHRWLEQHSHQVLAARALAQLLARLQAGQPPGRIDLATGWQLRWDQRTLWLQPAPAP